MSADARIVSSPDLAVLRDQIDALDQELLTLLNRRAQVAEQVGEVKRREGSPFYRPDRVAQVIARIQETFGVELPLRVLFENPTIAESAVHVDAAVRAAVEEWELLEELKHLDELSDAEVMKLLEGA